jgi:hypothetical protein
VGVGVASGVDGGVEEAVDDAVDDTVDDAVVDTVDDAVDDASEEGDDDAVVEELRVDVPSEIRGACEFHFGLGQFLTFPHASFSLEMFAFVFTR